MKKTALLCIGNGLMLEGITKMLASKNPLIQIREERSPNIFMNYVKTYMPNIILVEVKDVSPYTVYEWKDRIHNIKMALPSCKIAMIVDGENHMKAVQWVKNEKANGNIDCFFYASSGLDYLADVLDSL